MKIKRIPHRGQNLSLATHANGVSYLYFPGLDETAGVRHAFATRLGGVSTGQYESLNLGFRRGDDRAAVLENFRRMTEVVSAVPEDVVRTDQKHTANIRVVTAEDRGKGIVRERDYTAVDGLVTNDPSVVLTVFYADCVPVLFADPVKKAIGTAHAGWRGSVQGICGGIVEAMRGHYGTEPSDLYAAIGPSICGSCYEVGEDVACMLRAQARDGVADQVLIHREDMPEGKYFLDLHRLNRLQLEAAGIPPTHILVTDVCTKCNPELLFSHRVLGDARGAHTALLRLAPPVSCRHRPFPDEKE